MNMLRVTPDISIAEQEILVRFVRSSGPGGQNVNKVATAAELHFDVRGSLSLPGEVKDRLLRIAAGRITSQGVLILDARRFRSQRRNRDDAVERLLALIRQAAVRPKPRRKTAPTAASRQRRLDAKRRKSRIKTLRRTNARTEQEQ